MERLSMCRICLAEGLRMDSIIYTPLQDTYERLTLIQLDTIYPPDIKCTMRLAMTPVIVDSFGEEPVFDSVPLPEEQGGVEHEFMMLIDVGVGMEAEIDPIKLEPGLEDPLNVEPCLDDSLCGEALPEIPMDIVKDEPGNTSPKRTPGMQKKKPQDASRRIKCINVKRIKTNINERVNITSNIIIKNNKPSDTSSEEKSKRAKNKVFTCELCEKSFKQKEHLKRHIRIHTGEKPFTCDECGTSFYCRSGLKSHKKYSHPVKKKFACHLCDKIFNYKCLLNSHFHCYHTENGRVNNKVYYKIGGKCSDLTLNSRIQKDSKHSNKRIQIDSKRSDLSLSGRINNDNKGSDRRIQIDSKRSDLTLNSRTPNDSKHSVRRMQIDSKRSDLTLNRRINNVSKGSDRRIQIDSKRSDLTLISRINNDSKGSDRRIQIDSKRSDRRIQIDSKHSNLTLNSRTPNASKRTDRQIQIVSKSGDRRIQIDNKRSDLSLNSRTPNDSKRSNFTLSSWIQNETKSSDLTLNSRTQKDAKRSDLTLVPMHSDRLNSDSTLISQITGQNGKYKCVLCDEYYTGMSDLAVHNRIHAGEKPFKCNVCSKEFYTKTIWSKHVTNHSSTR